MDAESLSGNRTITQMKTHTHTQPSHLKKVGLTWHH